MVKQGMTWEQLLTVCLRDGKETILKRLEEYHRVLENQQVYLYGDPNTVHQASKMSAMLLKQDETMIKLRQMTEDDMRRILNKGIVDNKEGENK